MGWQEVEASPDPDRPNQPDPEYELRSKGYVERTILQQLTSWDQKTDEFTASWSDGKPTSWLFPPVAAVRDPSVKSSGTYSRGEFDPDPSLEATVRRALARLHDRGLLDRDTHPDDARQVVWTPTDDGVTEAAMLADRYAADLAALQKRYGVADDDRGVVGSYKWEWFHNDRHTDPDA
jgi:DNA-binding HxlR family transcriptional regulator